MGEPSYRVAAPRAGAASVSHRDESRAPRHRLPAHQKLRRQQEFQELFGQGRRISGNLISICVRKAMPERKVGFVAGRNLDVSDSGARPIVISEGLARRFWPGQPAIGKTMKSDGWGAPRSIRICASR